MPKSETHNATHEYNKRLSIINTVKEKDRIVCVCALFVFGFVQAHRMSKCVVYRGFPRFLRTNGWSVLLFFFFLSFLLFVSFSEWFCRSRTHHPLNSFCSIPLAIQRSQCFFLSGSCIFFLFNRMNDYDLIFMCEKRRVKWTTFTVCSIWIALLWANFAFAVHFSTSCITNTVANTGTFYMSMEVGSTSNEMAIEVTSFKNSHIHIDKQTNQPYYYTHFHNFSGRTVNRQNNKRYGVSDFWHANSLSNHSNCYCMIMY